MGATAGEKETLHNQFTNVTGEKDNLQGQLKLVTEQKEELKGELTNVTGEKDALQGQLTLLAREKNELNVQFTNLTGEKDNLQGRLTLLTEEKEALVERTGAAAAGDPADRLSNFFTSGMFLRLTILVAVTMQNTSYALVRRYSRGHLKERYSTSSALLVMELAKLLLSMWMVVFSGHASDVPSGNAISKYVWLIGHSWKMMVPAVICKSQAPTEPAGWTSTSACFRSAATLTLARLL